MKRFFRNLVIIAVVDFSASALVSLDAISLDWKLSIMFLGGLIAGAIIAAFDERALQKKIIAKLDEMILRKKIEMLQRIRENLNIKD